MTRINRLLLSLLLMLITPSVIYGEIISTYSIDSASINFAPIKKLLPKIDDNTLVLINIDNTIITPKSKMFRYNNNSSIYFLDDLYSLAVLRPKINQIIAKLLEQRQMMLVEDNWPDLINKMKNQGATVLGFTSVTSACNLIDNYEKWLYSMLYGFNINFTREVNNSAAFRFDPVSASAPIFYAGIIFTGASKVDTLIEFLKLLPKVPTKIVIFENNKTELKRINTYLRMVDIVYYGVEYLGSQQIPGSPDPEIVKLQQATLLNTGQWLEDAEAAKIVYE